MTVSRGNIHRTSASKANVEQQPNNSPRRRFLPARQVFVRALWFLALGAALNIAIAYALGLFVDVSQGRVETSGAWTGRNQWTVTRWARAGATYILSVREPGDDWSPGQATGPPDTPTGGDQVTAWASQTPDGQAEWLVLDYAQAVVPKALRVYEIYGTGAVNRVTLFDAGGNEVEAWSGVDPAPRGRTIATSEIPLAPVGFATKRVKIYLDSPNVPNWNEVDAVGLVGPDDRVQWAVGAEASSTYASSRGGLSLAGGGPTALAPAWARLDAPTDDFVARRIATEQRAVDARGWPALSLYGNVPAAKATWSTPGGSGTVQLSGAAFVSGLLVTGGSTPRGAPAPGEPPLLVRPIWRGFLFNTVFYAVVLVGLYWALTAPRRFVRELGRLRRGCCVACGYDLEFDFKPGCPECGWRREGASARCRMPNAE